MKLNNFCKFLDRLTLKLLGSSIKMGISNMTLVKIASIGGIITVSMGYALRVKLDHNIKQMEYYKEAMHALRSHRAAVHLLGEPIKDGNIDVGDDEKNYTKHLSAKYEVPVRGPKQKGTLYFWAKKSADCEKWTINRIELGLRNEPDRRLLIKSLDNS